MPAKPHVEANEGLRHTIFYGVSDSAGFDCCDTRIGAGTKMEPYNDRK